MTILIPSQKTEKRRSAIGKIVRAVLRRTWQPVVVFYLRKDRRYRWNGISLVVKKGVFHPGFFYSTKHLISWLDTFELRNKTLLELGCGSGLISIYAARRGSDVSATDISQTAVNALIENALRNKVKIRVLHSDLFSNIPPGSQFDFIIINPPYFKGEPGKESEHAWFAGKDLQYFQKLFSQLPARAGKSRIFMILSDVADEKSIMGLAHQNGLLMKAVDTRKIMFEQSTIYEIT